MKKKLLLTAIVLTILFIPKIVNAEDRIHFINSRDGDGIIIETTGADGKTHYGLIDTLNPTTVYENDKDRDMTEAGTGELIKSYMQNLDKNATRFDFIILTHNHYDHIGGIPILVDYIDEKTLVFYKEDVQPNNDIEIINDKNSNKYFFDIAKATINSQNAITCDVTKASKKTNSQCNMNNINDQSKMNGRYIKTITYDKNKAATSYDTNVKEKIYFTFGNFTIEMYSLYPISNHAENINSIVTLVTHTTSHKKAALTGDILTGPIDCLNSTVTGKNKLIIDPTHTGSNITNCKDVDTSRGIENQIADAIGKVDLLKSAHHGGDKSNSLDALDKYKPRFYITTYGANIDNYDYVVQSFNEANIVAMTYLKNKYTTSSYFTSQAEGAVVAEFSNTDISIKGYNKDAKAINKSLQDASKVVYKYYDAESKTVGIKDGWISSYGKNFNDIVWMYMNDGIPIINDFIYDNDEKYYMDLNGLMYTGWKEKDGKWYYFRKARNEISDGSKGSAVKGWGKIDNKWYYFTTEGKMVTGWQKIDNKWYYFTKGGDMVTGWKTIDGKTYYFTKGGDMVTGWKTIDGKKYYFTKGGDMVTGWKTIDGKQYYFDENGVLIQ